jgi:transposase
MTTSNEIFVGIDVGKTWLDLAIWGSQETWQFSNDASGVDKVVDRLVGLAPTLVVIEATGGYEQLVVQELLLRGFSVAVVNPTRVRALAKATGKLAKTDTIDARLIAEYAFKVRPAALAPQEASQMGLKALVSRREQLVEMRAAEQNRLGTIHSSMKIDVREHIEWISQRIQLLEDEIKALLASLPALKALADRLDTIPGVGFITAVSVVVDMPELGQLDRQKIAALAGLAPFNRDSGQKRGKRRIFGGRKGVRRVLYMACLSAMIHNPIIRSMYQRLTEKGKIFKVAITACMRKMLTIMNAMIRYQVDWNPSIPISG